MTDLRIVKVTDFTGELLVVGYENPNSGVCQDLTAAIDKYEPIYLTSVLGYGFYQHVMEVIAADPANVPEDYANLIDGTDYLYNGMLYYWEGLRHHTAEYIYYWYNRWVITQTAGIGQVIPKAENSAVVSMSRKMIDSYNRAMIGTINCAQFMGTVEWPDEQPAPTTFGYKMFDPINIFGI